MNVFFLKERKNRKIKEMKWLSGGLRGFDERGKEKSPSFNQHRKGQCQTITTHGNFSTWAFMVFTAWIHVYQPANQPNPTNATLVLSSFVPSQEPYKRQTTHLAQTRKEGRRRKADRREMGTLVPFGTISNLLKEGTINRIPWHDVMRHLTTNRNSLLGYKGH